MSKENTWNENTNTSLGIDKEIKVWDTVVYINSEHKMWYVTIKGTLYEDWKMIIKTSNWLTLWWKDMAHTVTELAIKNWIPPELL